MPRFFARWYVSLHIVVSLLHNTITRMQLSFSLVFISAISECTALAGSTCVSSLPQSFINSWDAMSQYQVSMNNSAYQCVPGSCSVFCTSLKTQANLLHDDFSSCSK